MAANVNLDGFQDHGYFSRAWALVTQEKGWWKPVLLLGLATLVPIVGPIAVLGYCLEWARRIAWGSTAAPERHVKVGELLASGWRGIVVLLGWAIVSGIVGGILGKVPVLGGLLGFAWSIFSIFLGMLFMVAAARATIYQSFKAGYRAKTIWEMGRRDPMGLLRVWLIRLVSGIVIGFVSLCIVVPAIVKVIPYAINFFEYGYYGYASDYEILYFLSNVLGDLGPAIIWTVVIGLVLAAVVNLLTYAAIGLWLRQFDVPAWGKDEDPLPQSATAVEEPNGLPKAPEPSEPAASSEPEPPAAEAAPAPVPGAPVVAEKPAEDATPAQPEPAEAPHAAIPMPPVSEPEPPVPGTEDSDSDDDSDPLDGAEVVEVEPVAQKPAVPEVPAANETPAPNEAPAATGEPPAEENAPLE